MKSNKLPLYMVFLLVGVALVWRIANPPAPTLPGPINGFPGWKSLQAIGEMSSQTVNPSGTLWAGAWNEALPSDKTRSAVRIIDFNDYSARAVRLPDDIKVDYLSWADDTTIRVVSTGIKTKVISVDAATGKRTGETELHLPAQRVVAWPAGSDNMAVVFDETDNSIEIGVISASDKGMVGKAISFPMPKGSTSDSGGDIALDGSSFVFSISDPAAKGGRAYYLADPVTGTAKKAFELGDVPGRIEGIWPSEAGVLLVCKVNDKLEDLIYDPSTGKLIVQKDGVGDLGKWPGAPKVIALTSYDGGFEFDLATGKSKTTFDLRKRNSQEEKSWRDMIRGSRFYRLTSGNFVTVSETSGAIDIRELKRNGEWYRNMLSRQ